ncbi:AAA family ATPase [Nesterenkonia salmonea]|uniref:AAA family ATPase n=1 Tax=Nesterenkonia salmonea TaxID=1804987 RepID=UPI00140734EA|nr:AAA family ATPase [Nesterenkonia salmonea]
MKDFKGLTEADLDIAPGKISILTGVNSSGKSSVIQSLLLSAQSLHSEGPVALNGPLVRLGNAVDLVRESSATGSISLALDLLPGFDADPDADDSLLEVHLQAQYMLKPSSDNTNLQPQRLEISRSGGDENPLVASHANSRASDVREAMEVASRVKPSHALHLKSLLGSQSRQLRTYVVMQGLRPVAVVQLMKPEQIAFRYREAVQAFLQELPRERSKPSSPTGARTGRWPVLREFVQLLAEATATKDQRVQSLVDHVQKLRGRGILSFEPTWRGFSESQRSELIDVAVEMRARSPYVVLPIRGPHWRYGSTAMGLLENTLEGSLGSSLTAISMLSETLRDVADRVQYLGPLRDEPRVVWNHWNELARSLPVGTRGEYSAAVLSRSSDSNTTYTAPDGQIIRSSLANAVNDWLAYLDIGDAVSARSHGKLGVGLDLAVSGRVRDLTSVGVGVSQTLPLLVGVLAAPQGALFIVEQPELHLHPGVQARLADFLMTARPDMAIIIETHSDSFVTRVRRRVAENAIALDQVDIIFVEPDLTGSRARKLTLTEFGNLSEWPQGFLSSAEEDVRAILQANIRRTSGTSNAS